MNKNELSKLKEAKRNLHQQTIDFMRWSKRLGKAVDQRLIRFDTAMEQWDTRYAQLLQKTREVETSITQIQSHGLYTGSTHRPMKTLNFLCSLFNVASFRLDCSRVD